MSRRDDQRAPVIERLHRAAEQLLRPVAFMEVCGTHTVAAFRSGLHSLMPANVRLISGPGCPVCVTSQGDIDQMIELATRPGVILCTYGDMLRVTGAHGSLERARAEGADVRIVYSSMDALRLARQHPNRQVIFAAVGFETTTPATAVAVLEARELGLSNFSAITSHKLIMPAMRALLEQPDIRIDGFVCPGHVSVILGADVFRPVVEQYRKPCVVAGFEGADVAEALARLLELFNAGRPALENLYPQVVSAQGNRLAQETMAQVFEPADAVWRGLGTIPQSGQVLRREFAAYDARLRFQLPPPREREIKGCICGDVITGRAMPADCTLFGSACTPIFPIGPCMVSSEGTCQAWFKYRRVTLKLPSRRPAPITGGDA